MNEVLWVPVSVLLVFLLVYVLTRAPRSAAADASTSNAKAPLGGAADAKTSTPATTAAAPLETKHSESNLAANGKASESNLAVGKASGSNLVANGKASESNLVANGKASESKLAVGKASGSNLAANGGPSEGKITPPRIEYEEDEEVDPTRVGIGTRAARKPSMQPPTQKIVYDEDAATDEPTHSGALILVTARAQTDKGLRRKRNEDSMLVLEENAVYVVADGMGGYHGGEIASHLAVETLQRAFVTQTFEGLEHETIPRRASELARAIQMANDVILDRAQSDKELEGMGTTICAAHFSPNKQRMYIGHVGDSRLYRLRGGKLRQMTSDHTMKDLGITGAGSDHLSRAVGIWPAVPIDIILGKPQPGDLYIICSDGLTKMVDDEGIAELLSHPGLPQELVDRLVDAANAKGGKDNISVIAIRVDDPLHPFVEPS
jgi:protein phosphatase